MPQPNSPHITSPPAVQGQQPYDATTDERLDVWVKPKDVAGQGDGEIAGAEGPAPWKQT